MKKILSSFVMIFFGVTIAMAQRLAVNTDLAMDAAMAPSFGAELVLTRSSSLNINGLYGEKVLGKDFRIFALQPEWRQYFSGRPMYHHYFGIVGLLSNYKMHFDDKWHDGDALGGGLSYGYVLPITQRLAIDFHTSLGLVYYHQKEYFTSDNYDEHHLNPDGYPVANSSGTIIMPLRLGISLTYIIK